MGVDSFLNCLLIEIVDLVVDLVPGTDGENSPEERRAAYDGRKADKGGVAPV